MLDECAIRCSNRSCSHHLHRHSRNNRLRSKRLSYQERQRRRLLREPKDIAMQLYMAYLYEWRKQTNLSDEMVNAGKIKYFIEAMAPELPDHILLGYSEEQMKWADENEGNVWADIVGNQRLFSTGLDMHMTFLADGPFTQEYSNEAPSRLGEFLGLHIIRSYMANNEVTLPQLMKNKDFQGIFQNSNYKPKKN